MAESGCSQCCIGFIFTLGLTALFLWLSLRPNNPSCSIRYFYIPALNKTLNSQTNTTLNFMVRLDNSNKDMSVFYDDVHLSFSGPPIKTRFVGNYTIPRFQQGRKKKAKKWGQIQPRDKEVVLRAASPNGTAVFRVDLVTQVRFKIVFWKTKRRRIAVGADVEVNDQGAIAKKKSIKMKKSNSPENSCNCLAIGVLINLFVFIFISP